MEDNHNMRIYEKARSVPDEAKKPITAGRLKGMTDINPMYRIKRLTEIFGPCGIGWWYEVTRREMVGDERAKETAAFVDIVLYYKDPETGETSKGIPGTGGALFLAQESRGPHLSDEAWKMATTDALSVAAKALGVAANVYFDADRTKYTAAPQDTSEKPQPLEKPPAQAVTLDEPGDGIMRVCSSCGANIKSVVYNGKRLSAITITGRSAEKFGQPMCWDCYCKWSKVGEDPD